MASRCGPPGSWPVSAPCPGASEERASLKSRSAITNVQNGTIVFCSGTLPLKTQRACFSDSLSVHITKVSYLFPRMKTNVLKFVFLCNFCLREEGCLGSIRWSEGQLTEIDLKGPLGVYGLHIHCHCLIIPISQMNRTRYREGEWFSVLVPGEPLQVHCVGPSRPWGQGPGSGDFESVPRGCWCEVSVPPFLGWNRALGLGETLTNCRTQRGATVSWCPPPPPPGGICGHTVYLDDTGCRKAPRALRRAPLSAESRKGHGRGPQMLRPYNPRALLWVAG